MGPPTPGGDAGKGLAGRRGWDPPTPAWPGPGCRTGQVPLTITGPGGESHSEGPRGQEQGRGAACWRPQEVASPPVCGEWGHREDRWQTTGRWEGGVGGGGGGQVPLVWSLGNNGLRTGPARAPVKVLTGQVDGPACTRQERVWLTESRGGWLCPGTALPSARHLPAPDTAVGDLGGPGEEGHSHSTLGAVDAGAEGPP